MPDITLRGDDLGDHIATRSLKQIKGSDVASADSITLQADGNTFDVTGTTTINHITSTNWIVGSVMILHFDGAITLTNNAGGLTGSEANILLSGDVNYTTSAGDILTFVLHDSTNWQEISRNSIGYSAPTIGSTSIASGSTNASIAGLTLTTSTITAPAFNSYTDMDVITIPSDPASGKGRVYVKTIDVDNDGIFIKVKKAGSYAEVQIG